MIPGLWQVRYKISMEYDFIPESKEVLNSKGKGDGSLSQGYIVDANWPNLGQFQNQNTLI